MPTTVETLPNGLLLTTCTDDDGNELWTSVGDPAASPEPQPVTVDAQTVADLTAQVAKISSIAGVRQVLGAFLKAIDPGT